jgi:uncharacterized protein YjiS (DUF1127 family)
VHVRSVEATYPEEATMNTTQNAIELRQTTASALHVFSFFSRYRDAFRTWRKRTRLRAELYGLNDRELTDLGISRGELDYVTSDRFVDL